LGSFDVFEGEVAETSKLAILALFVAEQTRPSGLLVDEKIVATILAAVTD
jgi:hypothetical protein